MMRAGELFKILERLAASDRLTAEEADAMLFASILIKTRAQELAAEKLGGIFEDQLERRAR